MAKTIFFICAVLFSWVVTSCSSTSNISGKYRSNFAVSGFFITRINLNIDSTFGYRSSGDMMFDTSNGHYSFDKKYVILSHEPFKIDTTEFEKYGKTAVLLSYALSKNQHRIKPEKYMVGYKKLRVCDSRGNVIKKQFGYSKHRKYLLFGNHWYKRRYYLKQTS